VINIALGKFVKNKYVHRLFLRTTENCDGNIKNIITGFATGVTRRVLLYLSRNCSPLMSTRVHPGFFWFGTPEGTTRYKHII